MTKACLSLDGKVPEVRELFVMRVRGSARSSMFLARREPEIPSRPQECLYLRDRAVWVISEGLVGSRKIDLVV